MTLKCSCLILVTKKGTVKRMFSILVEGLQNIRLHGEKGKEGHQTSFFAIDQGADFYKIALGNLIYTRHNKDIESRITEINKMTREEVKTLYMEVLTNGIISNKGGAGLGFITMAMKSSNNLDCFFDEINNELSCFTLIITLDRKKKSLINEPFNRTGKKTLPEYLETAIVAF